MESETTRRSTLALLCSACVTALAGCGGDGTTAEPSPSEEPPTEAPTRTPEPSRVDVARPDSFAYEMEYTIPLDSGDLVQENTGYVDGTGNWHHEVTETSSSGSVDEFSRTRVDGTVYAVDVEGECSTYAYGAGLEQLPVLYAEAAPMLEELEVTETTTFEGEEVHAIEFDTEDAGEYWDGEGIDGPEAFAGTYYVSVDTGYVVGGEWVLDDGGGPKEGTFRLSAFDEDVDVAVPEEC